MSTKIYNGYYSKLNLKELLNQFKKLIPEFEQIKLTNYAKHLAEVSTFILDEKKHNNQEFDLESILKKQIDQDHKQIKESLTTGFRTPEIDYSANCVLFPLGQKTLILFYCDNSEVLKLWEKQDFTHDYHYQNNSDKPDEISSKDWNARRKSWDKVLGGNGWGIPAQNGLSFTFQNLNLPYLYQIKEQLNSFIPSNQERANKLAHQDFHKERKGEYDLENVFSSYWKIQDQWHEFKKTEEYNQKIEDIIKTLENINFIK